MKKIKFLRKYRMFNRGEEAGVRDDIADMLVEMGVAKLCGESVVTRAARALKDKKKTRAMKRGKTKG